MKKKNTIHIVRADKSNCKEIKYGTTPWALKQNLKVNSKINDRIKKSPYNWITHNPQVFQSPTVNDFLKVNIDGHTETQLVQKPLLQVSVLERHNRVVIDPLYRGLREARDAENNIIISDYTLRSLLPPKFKNVIKMQTHVWL